MFTSHSIVAYTAYRLLIIELLQQALATSQFVPVVCQGAPMDQSRCTNTIVRLGFFSKQ